MRQTAAVGVIKKDILLPKPDQTFAPAYGSMFGSPDVNIVKSLQPVEAATVYHTATNLGYAQFYGTTSSMVACTTPVSFQADASSQFNGADPESRAPARLEVGSNFVPQFNSQLNSFGCSHPSTTTPFDFTATPSLAPFTAAPPGVFVFGVTNRGSLTRMSQPRSRAAASNLQRQPAPPTRCPPRPSPAQRLCPHRQPTTLPPLRDLDKLYQADLAARTSVLVAYLARTLDTSAVTWQGERCSYQATALLPPPLLPLQDFSHVTGHFVMRHVQLPNGRVVWGRVSELQGPEADIVAIRELQSLRFDPRIKGLTTYAFAKYTTVYEARRWARENGHAYRPHMWRLKSPDGPFRLCPADQIASLLRNMCQGYEEDRGVHFPGLVLMQRFVRRFLARRKQEITVAELDSLIEQAATRIQRTARCYLFRVRLSRRPPASIAAPVFSGPLNDASSQPDTALPKPVTVDWTQEVLADTDDAASAASTLDMTALLLGLLLGPWTTRRRRNPRRGSLCRHVLTSTAYRPETLVPNATATAHPWPQCGPPQHRYCSRNNPKSRLRLSIDHGCTDGTGPRPSFEPK
jgi:hypothetical protein